MRACLPCIALLVATGCVSSSIASEVARVRELSGAEELAAVEEGEVDLDEQVDLPGDGPLALEDAVRAALLHNRPLRAELRELGVSRGAIAQAGLPANPVVEVEVLPERNTTVELRVEYDVSSLVLAPIRAHARGAELDAARTRAAGAVIRLGYEVRAAYRALQAAEETLALGQQMLDALAAGRDAAGALHDAGNVPAIDASRRIVAYESARIAVAELELAVVDRREALHVLLGVHGDATRWAVSATLEAPPAAPAIPDDVERRAIEASLDLAASRADLEAAARRIGLARVEGWLPEIDVDVHVLEGEPEVMPTTGEGLRVGAGVSVGVPLFDRSQGTARSHVAAFDGLMERHHGIAIEVRSAARRVASHVRSLHARAMHLSDVVVPAARGVLEHTVLQYDAMQIGIFELLTARRELLAIEVARVETLAEYHRAVAELEALLAGKLVAAPARASTRTMDSSGGEPEGGH